jgi:DHA1 family bicyclomycin/chloramphenicol resistance-like MFS transporter
VTELTKDDGSRRFRKPGQILTQFNTLGLLFGNLNALAMRPLVDLAGLSSSIIASISSIVAFIFASVMVAMAASPVWAVAWAFTLAALLAGILIFRAIPVRPFMQLFCLLG